MRSTLSASTCGTAIFTRGVGRARTYRRPCLSAQTTRPPVTGRLSQPVQLIDIPAQLHDPACRVSHGQFFPRLPIALRVARNTFRQAQPFDRMARQRWSRWRAPIHLSTVAHSACRRGRTSRQ